MGLRYSQGTYNLFKYGESDQGFQFKVQIADSSGTVKALLNNQIVSLDWGYRATGGCDKFKCVLKREFDDFENITASNWLDLYDFRVYITSAFGGTSTLFYRGYITNIRPSLEDQENIIINGEGYGNRLKEILMHDGTGAPKEYTSSTISGVVNSIITDFVASNTSITAGTVDTFSTEVTSIKFGDSVYDALSKLADIVGAEWGVDRALELYFRTPSATVGYRWFVGLDIGEMEDEIDYSEIVNSVIVEGGIVSSAPYRYLQTEDWSVTAFGLKQERFNNSSVIDATLAAKFASSILNKRANYVRNISLTLPFNKTLIESSNPLPLVAIKKATDQYTKKYGTFKYGASSSKPLNQISNGNFEDGTPPTGWTLVGADAVVARSTTQVKIGTYSLALTRAGTDCLAYQTFHENFGLPYWNGKTVTAGCWVWADTADVACIVVDDGGGTGGQASGFHSGDSTWQWLTVSTTLYPDSNTSINLQVRTADKTAYFDGAIVVEGSECDAFYPGGGNKKYSGELTHRLNSVEYSLKDVSLDTTVELNFGKPDIMNRFEELAFSLEQQRQSEGV